MPSLTADQIASLESVISKLEALHSEFTNLCKKTHDGTLNKFKAGIVNQVLEIANSILGRNRLPIAGFQQLDIDALPTNSDTTLVLSQYIGAIEIYRCEHIFHKSYNHWIYLSNDEPEVETFPPKKLEK